MRKSLSTLLQSISTYLDSSETSKPPPDLATIEEHAERIDDDGPTVDARLALLQGQVEFLTEESGQENKFRTQLSDYVKDLQEEARFIRTARVVFGIIATIVALALLSTPIVLLFVPSAPFATLPPYPKSAFLIGMIAGGVLLIQALTKSVYRSAHERQKDEFIPPQVKVTHDLVKGGDGSA